MALSKQEIEQHASQAYDRPQSLRSVLDVLTTLNELPDHANDGAAATGGVPVGGLYRNGSVIQVRVS